MMGGGNTRQLANSEGFGKSLKNSKQQGLGTDIVKGLGGGRNLPATLSEALKPCDQEYFLNSGLHNPSGNNRKRQEENRNAVDLQDEGQFTLGLLRAQAHRDLKAAFASAGFQQDNAAAEHLVQEAAGHSLAEAPVVMKEAAFALDYREASNQVSVPEIFNCKPRIGANGTSESRKSKNAKDADLNPGFGQDIAYKARHACWRPEAIPLHQVRHQVQIGSAPRSLGAAALGLFVDPVHRRPSAKLHSPPAESD
jgi:hypothetical protein